jgi:ribosomal protein L29
MKIGSKLSQKQLERKLGKLTTVLDGLRAEARMGLLPGTIRMDLARAADDLASACNQIRSLTLGASR